MFLEVASCGKRRRDENEVEAVMTSEHDEKDAEKEVHCAKAQKEGGKRRWWGSDAGEQ